MNLCPEILRVQHTGACESVFESRPVIQIRCSAHLSSSGYATLVEVDCLKESVLIKDVVSIKKDIVECPRLDSNGLRMP